MDEDTREVMKEFKDENRIAHDELKTMIKCLPCQKHEESINLHNSRLAVLESQKIVTTTTTSTQNGSSKLDWKIVGILGTVIVTLTYLVEKIVNK